MSDPIRIDVRTPETVVIDVSNKINKVSTTDLKDIINEFRK